MISVITAISVLGIAAGVMSLIVALAPLGRLLGYQAIEGAVFRAAAELIGRDPWEVAPDRWRHH